MKPPFRLFRSFVACRFLNRPLTKDSVVYDIGAGSGAYVFLAATCTGVPCIAIGSEQDDHVYRLGESIASACEKCEGVRVARCVENVNTADIIADGMEGVSHLVGYSGSSYRRVETEDDIYLHNYVNVIKAFMESDSSEIMLDTKLSPDFFEENLADAPRAQEWKLGLSMCNAHQGNRGTTAVHIWVKTKDQLRIQEKVPPWIDLGGGGILRMTVELGAYDVMVAEPGCVAEKDREYRADTSYWRSRLCCGGDVDNPKQFRWVMVFGGVGVFDSMANWFIAEHMGHSLTEGVGERIVGPFSNKYTKTFDGSVWEIRLGMIAQRHRKGEEQNDNSSPQQSKRIAKMIFAAKRRSRTPMCTVPLQNMHVPATQTGRIAVEHLKHVDYNIAGVGFLLNVPIELPHALLYPGDVVVYYTDGFREMGVFGGALFVKKTGEEFAVIRAPTVRRGTEFMALPWSEVQPTGLAWGVNKWLIEPTIRQLVDSMGVEEEVDATATVASSGKHAMTKANTAHFPDADTTEAEDSSSSWGVKSFGDKKRRSNRVQFNAGLKKQKDTVDAAEKLAQLKRDLNSEIKDKKAWKKKAETVAASPVISKAPTTLKTARSPSTSPATSKAEKKRKPIENDDKTTDPAPSKKSKAIEKDDNTTSQAKAMADVAFSCTEMMKTLIARDSDNTLPNILAKLVTDGGNGKNQLYDIPYLQSMKSLFTSADSTTTPPNTVADLDRVREAKEFKEMYESAATAHAKTERLIKESDERAKEALAKAELDAVKARLAIAQSSVTKQREKKRNLKRGWAGDFSEGNPKDDHRGLCFVRTDHEFDLRRLGQRNHQHQRRGTNAADYRQLNGRRGSARNRHNDGFSSDDDWLQRDDRGFSTAENRQRDERDDRGRNRANRQRDDRGFSYAENRQRDDCGFSSPENRQRDERDDRGRNRASRQRDDRGVGSAENRQRDDRGFSSAENRQRDDRGFSSPENRQRDERDDRGRNRASRQRDDRGVGSAENRQRDDRAFSSAENRKRDAFGSAENRQRDDRGFSSAEDRQRDDRGFSSAENRQRDDRGSSSAENRPRDDRGSGSAESRQHDDRGFSSPENRQPTENRQRDDGGSSSAENRQHDDHKTNSNANGEEVLPPNPCEYSPAQIKCILERSFLPQAITQELREANFSGRDLMNLQHYQDVLDKFGSASAWSNHKMNIAKLLDIKKKLEEP
jgi:hypothetical protein